MKAVRKINKGKAMSAAMAIGIGTGVCILISVLMAAITAVLIHNENIPQESAGVAATLTHLLASATGGLTAVLLSEKMPAVVSGITCSVYFLLLLGCNILFMEGQFGGVGGGLISVAFGTVLSLLPALIKKNGRKLKRPRFG